MKVILSRKGFDTQYGKQPSPILPNGTLLSFPIPSSNDKHKFTELYYKGKSYYDIIKELNPKTNITEDSMCHFDPDLQFDTMNRNKGWRPLFGQTGSSQGHLRNSKVGHGDLFLFFGRFRKTEYVNDNLAYKKDAPIIHLIFGYLQIGEIYSDISELPEELSFHPHAQKEKYYGDKNNCIYVASESLSFDNEISGGGFLKFRDDLVLTKKGEALSRWELPSFFKNVNISYHSSKSFKLGYFQSVAKGQEFVIDANTEVENWARKIIIN